MSNKKNRNRGHLSVTSAAPKKAAEVTFTVYSNAEPSLKSTVDIFTTIQLLISALSMTNDITMKQFQAQTRQADPNEPLKKREFLGPREAPKVYEEDKK